MCNAGYTISILCAAAVLFAKAAFAADGDSLPPADLFSRVQAVLQSGEFMAGIIGGAVAIHLVHLMWQAGKRAMTHTFFLGRRTLHYGVAAAVIGGLILLI
jgi:hypothetical protein